MPPWDMDVADGPWQAELSEEQLAALERRERSVELAVPPVLKPAAPEQPEVPDGR